MNPSKVIRRHKRKTAIGLLSLFGFQLLIPYPSVALTSGPSQPEFLDFEQASTTDMVDPFTGDFTYNIPLFELPGPNGGYPFNLSYHAGITPEQEASWVGLGWSLNAGAITRQVRGLPDEFNNEDIVTTKKVPKNVTLGASAGVGFELFGGDFLKAQLGLTAMYNTITGIGYSLDGGLGFPYATKSDKVSGELGMNFSLDPDQGLSLNPSLEIRAEDALSKNNINTMSLSSGYNSRQGLTDLGLGLTSQLREGIKIGDNGFSVPNGQTYGASLSLANNGYTPVVHTPVINESVAFQINGGAGWWGSFPNSYVKGFLNTQSLRQENYTVKGFGYKYLQNAGEHDLLDFNRERDGMIHKEAPNLALPVLMHDIYKIQGQGIGRMFRPLRNDIGVVYDNKSSSKTISVSRGADIAPAASHYGINLGLLLADNTSGRWNYSEHSIDDNFTSFTSGDDYEPWYYKVHGEHTAMSFDKFEGLGREEAVDINLGGTAEETTVSWAVENQASNRSPRVGAVVEVTNKQLRQGNESVYKLLQIDEEMLVDGTRQLDRATHGEDHVAGYITTNEQGLRYVYALPVLNTEKHEVVYGPVTPDEDKIKTSAAPPADASSHPYYSQTTTGQYAHSHLLTSVVGPDYVDVTGDGVTEDDLGYWVKFNYEKLPVSYNWKTPYEDAFYNEGTYANDQGVSDDRGSFEYGRKEVYYLSKAETKTHIAEFATTDRNDNRGLSSTDFSGFTSAAAVTKRLANVTLYAKRVNTALPDKKLLSVHFEHDYSLCKDTPSSSPDVQQGKLTLNEVHFNYGESERKLNRYSFEYDESLNENYATNSQDRWGFYKPDSPVDGSAEGAGFNKIFPYIDQAVGKEQQDIRAAMWSMTGITLPSGGKIEIDYEMDTYAYVQHKRAMKMASIESGTLAGQEFIGLHTDDKSATYQEYYDALNGEDIYFKARVNNLNGNHGELISGYIDHSRITPQNGSGFKLTAGDHPISEKAWQHMRTNAPKLVNSDVSSQMDGKLGFQDFFPVIQILVSATEEIKRTFKGFNGYARDKNWANTLDQSQAWIRVPVLRQEGKYGGGHRVRRILIKENGDSPGENIYGQVYDYTMKDEDGNVITSGVASYEPLIGGEENPFRRAKRFTQKVPLHSDNNLFFEYPVNEGSYPGASVGYQKVTVMSLAAAERYAEFEPTYTLQEDLLPNGVEFGTTGKMEYEFYTAKDFPTLTDETIKREVSDKKWIPVPFLGVNSKAFYTASQGYSVVTNDMHGKLKRSSQYRQKRTGAFESTPYSYTSYTYRSDPISHEGEKAYRLNNYFERESGDFSHLLTKGTENQDELLGVETEMVIDSRRYTDQAFNGGLSFNLDVLNFLFGVIPIPTSWPNLSHNITEVKTVVSNKIIHKSGILEQMETFSDGAKVTTEYMGWDALTGRPLLSKVISQFEATPTYQYTTPGYTQYAQMGPAYLNLGLTFEMTNVFEFPVKEEFEASITSPTPGLSPPLIPGDEIIIQKILPQEDGSQTLETVGSGIYVGKYSASHRFHTKNFVHVEVGEEKIRYQATVVRSGNRNHLTADIGSVRSLQSPLENGTVQENAIQKTVVIPRSNTQNATAN